MIINEQQLREAYTRLPPIAPQYMEEQSLWSQNRMAMRAHVANNDIEEMLRWSTIHSTMFTVKAPYLNKEYNALMKDNTNRWMKAIEETGVGTPHRFDNNPKTSGNLVHQAYHLMQFERRTGITINKVNRIVEFGGGYGAMCAICRRLGFVGEYYLYDLPEFCLIQDYYLHQVGIADKTYYHDVDDFGRFPAPPLDTDLLIGCHSLSEVSDSLRETFISATNADYVLIALGVMWGKKDTKKAVGKMAKRLNKYHWVQEASESWSGQSYLVGTK